MDQADIVSSTHTVRGCHELLLLINGHHIAGSPFPVNVSNHPTQPSKPVNVWTRISSPVGITANSKGEILVALSECPIDIVKYDAEGKRVDIVKKNSLVKPRCIACDDEDNIYCTDVDRGSNKILTCDNNGDDNLNIHEVELEKNSHGRTAIAIVDQKLMVAEFCRPRIIKVYNKQLQHMLSFKLDNVYDIMDILVDIRQNLYASDTKN